MTTNQPTTTTALFLLVLKDDGKPESMGQQTGYGLAGALLTDLVAAGRLAVSDDGKKLHVLSPAPTGDALLDEGLRRFAERDGKRLTSVIPAVARKLERAVGDYLAERGVVRVEEGGMLGLKPQRYPIVDPSRESELRRGLVEVLRGASPTAEQHSLIGLIHGLQLGTKVFHPDEVGLDKGDLKRRLKAVAESAGPGSDGVARAVQSANTAMIAAITAATIASSSGSS
ncbi:GOLPH3/VPS74 family protein [Arsenicicoccus sp. oral taxon 190]|uniref:GOLPH3/VPS74 family protein n=1 Tax=Arsenicicoccus sp. oral taxon 190 TaxID=1658671 RepID=UPI00067AC7A9|nr:GPP34 family phosphoprotein [Arsenicicoccus sp. oral taxon 190]